MRRIAMVLGLTAGFAVACATTGSSELYKSGLRSAKKNASTSAGAEYDHAFTEGIIREVERILLSCLGGAKRLLVRRISIVMKVEESGTISEWALDRNTRFGRCVADGMVTKTFPKPPAPGHWVELKIQLE